MNASIAQLAVSVMAMEPDLLGRYTESEIRERLRIFVKRLRLAKGMPARIEDLKPQPANPAMT